MLPYPKDTVDISQSYGYDSLSSAIVGVNLVGYYLNLSNIVPYSSREMRPCVGNSIKDLLQQPPNHGLGGMTSRWILSGFILSRSTKHTWQLWKPIGLR